MNTTEIEFQRNAWTIARQEYEAGIESETNTETQAYGIYQYFVEIKKWVRILDFDNYQDASARFHEAGYVNDGLYKIDER